MQSLAYALLVILCWGSWLAVAKPVRSVNPHATTLYLTASNCALSAAIFAATGGALPPGSFWLPFAGGLVWAVAGSSAFAAGRRIGIARGTGIWVPMNIFVGLAWGAALFGELRGAATPSLLLSALGLVVLVAGVLLMSVHGREEKASPSRASGYLFAALTGLLWGSYFIPVRAFGLSLWTAVLPMAIGQLVGAAALAAWSAIKERAAPVFERPSHYLRALLAGLLWGIGNYAMLLLGQAIGTGRGFAVAQVNLAVNALLCVYVLKEEEPASGPGRRLVLGAVVAALGGAVFGLSR